jgi:hypothetical protein
MPARDGVIMMTRPPGAAGFLPTALFVLLWSSGALVAVVVYRTPARSL